MKRLLIAVSVALVAAAPASAASIDTTHTIRAAGTVLAHDTTGTKATFSVNFHRGPGHKVVYRNATGSTVFHSQKITYVNYTNAAQAQLSGWAVKIRGVGMLNGKRVPFTAIAVDHPARLGTDIFRISMGHGASLGGTLTFGGIKILQL